MKKLFKLSMILMLFASVAFTSCTDEETTTTTPTAAKFAFMKVNNQWNYNFLMAGQVVDTMSIKVIASLGAGNFAVDMAGDSGVWYQSDNEFAMETNPVKVIMCKADAKVNDQYISVDQGDTTMYKVVGLGVSTTTPAGTFSCYKVEEYWASDFSGTFYLDKNYGIIKYDGSDGSSVVLKSKNF